MAGLWPETAHLSEWRAALERIQEAKESVIRGGNSVIGDDREHTDELKGHFQYAERLAEQAESAIRQVIAFLEGQASASQSG